MTVLSRLLDESNHRGQHFFSIGNDQLGGQEESVVAIDAIASHLVSVGDADVVIPEGMIDARARRGIC